MTRNHLSRLAQRLSLLVAGALAYAAQSAAQGPVAYPPYGPNIPVITNTEPQSGAYFQDQESEPPPNPPNQESIWNMKVEGFNDNQARPIYQPLIVNQNGREILYAGNLAGSVLNPLTNKMESNGTSIIDVTNVKKPQFLFHIPGPDANPITGSFSAAGAQMVRVCPGSTLPNSATNGTAGRWYLLRAFGNAGSVNESHQIWDVTDPAAPKFVVTVKGGLSNTHKSWWECDTGIAYLVAGSKKDGWQQSGSTQHLYIYDLSNPYSPQFIRQFGLVGQQPSANVATAQPCATAPGPNCYEGTTNPPAGIHGPISMGTQVNRVYMPYGVGGLGVIQIDDRLKLVNGCNLNGPGGNPNASPTCANNPTQADLLWPQVSWITMNPENGGHSSMPIFNVPIPEEQSNFVNGQPQSKSLLIVTSEGTANNCFGQAPHDAWILDISNEATPWPMATLSVPQFPGDFCGKGARFGAHAVTEAIYAPYYGKIVSISWFNAGVRIWDIRDPKNPKPIAYYIQAPDGNTASSCSTINGTTNCFNATMNDYVEYDDRGYIYAADRAGTGVTILSLTGEARQAVYGNAAQ
jgi:hypothetical protein